MESLELRKTGDGSHTLFNPEIGESYHSGFGAHNESMHVFITSGLYFMAEKSKELNIFEVGLGTGLNVLLTIEEAKKRGLQVEYTAIEPFPLTSEIVATLNYGSLICESSADNAFQMIHNSPWEEYIPLNDRFIFQKIKIMLQDFVDVSKKYELVYFDAFSPAAQPELWTEDIFRKIASMMKEGGVLVTYSAKGQVRRDMQAAGFVVERLPGPAGKREMLRGIISH
jgi:tRNA U34 5-methylaminomethyl-2-thiouridine-forming methyltransferase MnmC